MNNLNTISLIKKEKLNPANYFQSLVQEAYQLKVFSAREIEKIQMQTLELLARRTERYTCGDSSSVKTETAENILQSTLYTIGIYLKTFPDPDRSLRAVKETPLSELYRQGRELIAAQLKAAGELLDTVQNNRLTTDNIAYIDTINNALPLFFHDYDADFAAHDTPASIDYPLSNDKMELTGIEYITNYLQILSRENQFCRNFSADVVNCLLRGYDSHYQDLLINIFGIVFTNALGCVLAGKDARQLNINGLDRDYLKRNLADLAPDQLETLLKEAAGRLGKELNIDDQLLQKHMSVTAINISARLKNALANDKLDLFFLSTREKPAPSDLRFEDSGKMDDDLFRSATEEIRNCRYVSDKIAIIKREMHSLTDLVDILEAYCIFDDEFNEVFRAFGDMELALLYKSLPSYIDENLRLTESEKEWQNRLNGFLAALDLTRRNAIIDLAEKIELA